MADEIVDIYDENNERVGTATRSEAQAHGFWIRSFHCWLLDKNTKCVIFQKRAPDKRIYPNMWDISAAGHYTSGETIAQGVRELEEEIGLRRTIDDLEFLGIRTEVAKVGDAIVREFAYTYFLLDDLAPKQLKPDQVEVSGISYVPVKDGIRIFSGSQDSVGVKTLIPQEEKWVQRKDTFSASQVIPRKDPYYLKVFLLAERAFANRQPLAI